MRDNHFNSTTLTVILSPLGRCLDNGPEVPTRLALVHVSNKKRLVSMTTAGSNDGSNGSARHLDPLGIAPWDFTQFMFGLVTLYVLYLLLPRGFRIHHFGSYPKRYAWSARTRRSRQRLKQQYGDGQSPGQASVQASSTGEKYGLVPSLQQQLHAEWRQQHGGGGDSIASFLDAQTPPGRYDGESLQSSIITGTTVVGGASLQSYGPTDQLPYQHLGAQRIGVQKRTPHMKSGRGPTQREIGSASGSYGGPSPARSHVSLIDNENEVVVSATMQELRDPGIMLVAHGSKGKPKNVKLRLTVNSIAWRTETLRKPKDGEPAPEKRGIKHGKLHQVPLTQIMYVDVGKQTTALRRVENAAINDNCCFSLLTNEGSLDLESKSSRERDALVSAFSLVLDEVHATDWRDVTSRAPSPSDMPSSLDGDEGSGRSNGTGTSSREEV